MEPFMILENCRENNLKNVSLQIPKEKITVFAGVSGSGKSSLVFDTIAEEAGRQLNELFSNMVRLFLPRHHKPNADRIENLSAPVVINQRRLGGNARSTLGTITDINSLLRLFFSRFAQPHLGYGNSYSFNKAEGMCPECEGIGRVIRLNEQAALDIQKSLNQGAILLPGFTPGSVQWQQQVCGGFFDLDKELSAYSPGEWELLLYAEARPATMTYKGSAINTQYEGLATKYLRQNLKTEKERSAKTQASFQKFTHTQTCPRCEGKRLNPLALSSKIMGYSIHDLTSMQPARLIQTLNGFEDPAARPVLDSIIQRLQSLIDIGLGYMNLNRETSTLSGGESQRVKMVKQLSGSLNNMLYIFDEPSIGLHPHDIRQLNNLLVQLRDKGNTVLVVEHDPDVMRIADHLIEMGPKGGRHGGQVTYQGSFADLKQANTLTGRSLRETSSIKKNPRPAQDFLASPASSLHNLKETALKVPAHTFTVVTGVAGSGKSTLVNQVFAPSQGEVVMVDQSPVTANSRSNPATFTGTLDPIRKAFAKENNTSPGLFSYSSEGACPHCKGTGVVEVNLSFMDKSQQPCEVCGGTRYSKEALQHLYKGKNIRQALDMTASEASEFFEQKEITSRLRDIIRVGLGYITLGQPLSTLSGGECQRLRLAKELRKKGRIFILDEPTTGLHISDIEHILAIIDGIVDKKNTVIAIEHNLEVIKHADWIVDVGPLGGDRGGEILFEGTPHDLLDCTASLTAKALRQNLAKK